MLKAASNHGSDNDLTHLDGSGGIRSALVRVLGRVTKLGALFYIFVAIPTTAAIIYFGFLASDIYISESRFVIKSPNRQQVSGLGTLLKSAGFSNSSEEIIAVQNYIVSRDALRNLNKGGWVVNAFSNRKISIFNRFNPLGSNGSFEALYEYYTDHVRVANDTSSSITTVTVRAYAPDDALHINKTLLAEAEKVVNLLNRRGRTDMIRFASAEVEDAKAQASKAAAALATFRNRQGVIDPEGQAKVQLQMISKLQDELIATENQLVQLRTFAPQNAQIKLLEARASSLRADIDSERNKVVGGSRSLAATAETYQRLALDNQFAERQLATALASLEDARNEARRKQAYLETIVQPSRPDDARAPRRIRGVLATFVLGLVAWGVASLLLSGVREHQG